MLEVVQSFIFGLAIGSAFGALNLNAPVPPTLAGFMGIAGLFIGAFIFSRLR